MLGEQRRVARCIQMVDLVHLVFIDQSLRNLLTGPLLRLLEFL